MYRSSSNSSSGGLESGRPHCRYYVRGNCRKGNSCSYSHTQSDTPVSMKVNIWFEHRKFGAQRNCNLLLLAILIVEPVFKIGLKRKLSAVFHTLHNFYTLFIYFRSASISWMETAIMEIHVGTGMTNQTGETMQQLKMPGASPETFIKVECP